MGKIGVAIVREIREAIPATAFFFFLFHLVALTRAVSLEDYSITTLSAFSATVGALIVAKAILVVEALPIFRMRSDRRIVDVVRKTLLYSVVVLLFKFLEDWIPMISKHGGPVSAVQALYREISWPVFLVVALWIVSGLLLYCISSELVRAVGRDRVKEIFFGTHGERSKA